MGKRESFLLILIAAFLMLLLSVAFFSGQRPRVKALWDKNQEVEIVFGGDVMLGRSVLTKSEKMKDWAYPFRKVADRLQEADIVFVNLESPFVDNCPRTDSGMKFCTSPELVEGLRFANINIVNLANNHARDYGEAGLAETKKILNENRIVWVDDSNLEIIKKRGVKFGFLGFDFVSRQPPEADLKLVKDSDKKVDVLIVSVHWGEEYRLKPTNNQKLIAKSLIEAGADVIVGQHPHWVQEAEYVDGRPVYYSLGNFVFDQMWSEATRKGLLVKLTFKDGQIKKEEKLPIYMFSTGQPEFVVPRPGFEPR